MKISPLSVSLLLSAATGVSSATSDGANNLRGQKAAADTDQTYSNQRWHRVLSKGPQGTPSIIQGHLGNVGTTVSQANQVALENAAVAALTGLANDGTLGEDVKPGNGNGGGPPEYAPARGHNGRTDGTHFSKYGSAQIRVLSFVNGKEVEGAALVMNILSDGTIAGVNGEVVSTKGVPPENGPKLPPNSALEEALKQANLNDGNEVLNGEWVGSHRSAMVRTPQGTVCRAWSASYSYDTLDEDGSLIPHRDDIYADAGTGDLCASFPRIYGGGRRSSRARAARQPMGNEARRDVNTATIDYTKKESRALKGESSFSSRELQSGPSMITQNCQQRTSSCVTVSTSSSNINTGDNAVDAAHNYAIATYNFYKNRYNRNSIDGNGMTLVSRAHYSTNYNNAFWDGSQMTYGDGDGTTFIPLSQDADVVGHELTHGVTERTSNLIYSKESGALNEALSDIFGAMVDFEAMEGGSVTSTGPISENVWLLGEDIYTPGTPGDGLRVMNDPAAAGSYDWYPTRYTGTADNGGVHSNSGIANLAFYLMTAGGQHPRRSANQAMRLGSSPTSGDYVNMATPVQSMYLAADLFYYSNTNCLTPSSGFADIRYCTADVHGGPYAAEVHSAWDAVGVPRPQPPIVIQDGVTQTLSLSTGGKQDCTLSVIIEPGATKTVTCSTSGTNGDADLYLRFDATPDISGSSTNNECFGESSTSNEACTTKAKTNTSGSNIEKVLHALVNAYTTFSNLSVMCKINNSSGGGCTKYPAGTPCTSNSQCCSNRCAGTFGQKKCK